MSMDWIEYKNRFKSNPKIKLGFLTSGPSNEWIDILTKYQSLLLRELKYRDINGYSRYGLYKLYNQSWHGIVVICQG